MIERVIVAKSAAEQIGAPDRAVGQRVAGQQQRAVGRFDAEAAATRRVARRVDHFGGALPKK